MLFVTSWALEKIDRYFAWIIDGLVNKSGITQKLVYSSIMELKTPPENEF